jgi:hypothetical protein
MYCTHIYYCVRDFLFKHKVRLYFIYGLVIADIDPVLHDLFFSVFNNQTKYLCTRHGGWGREFVLCIMVPG